MHVGPGSSGRPSPGHVCRGEGGLEEGPGPLWAFVDPPIGHDWARPVWWSSGRTLLELGRKAWPHAGCVEKHGSLPTRREL